MWERDVIPCTTGQLEGERGWRVGEVVERRRQWRCAIEKFRIHQLKIRGCFEEDDVQQVVNSVPHDAIQHFYKAELGNDHE